MIGIIVVTATLGDQKKIGEQILNRLREKLSPIDGEFLIATADDDTHSIVKENLQKYSGLAIVIATGGTEANIRSLCRAFRKPLLLFCHPHHNSLASGLEVYGNLRFTRRIKLHYSIQEDDFSAISYFLRVVKVFHRLQKTKLASFGPPSKWVLTSENKKILGNFGLEYHELSFNTLQKSLNNVQKEEVDEAYNKLPSQFPVEECPKKDLHSSLQLYVALHNIIKTHRYDAVTICCFDLLTSGKTACLALALLNSEGIIAGCEGDVQALISMVLAHYLTGKETWMANPTRISYEENSITLAHCSAPFTMITQNRRMAFCPHKESGIGISFNGYIDAKKGVLLRVGGPDLENMLLSDCIVMNNNINDSMLCNIQLKLKMKESLTQWLNNSLGNHQIFVPDADALIFRDFAFFQNIEVFPKS